MPDKEFKTIILKTLHKIQENTDRQLNEIRNLLMNRKICSIKKQEPTQRRNPGAEDYNRTKINK